MDRKRIVICLDGTTNVMSAEYPTNVVWAAQTADPLDDRGVAQTIYYDQGVGTEKGERLRGSALGHGLDKNILEAYAFICLNYEFGDEIFVFGFSRGAYTARSLVGLISYCGLLPRKNVGQAKVQLDFYRQSTERDGPHTSKAREQRRKYSPQYCIDEQDYEWRCANSPLGSSLPKQIPSITYLGVWDTVAALGVPSWWDSAGLLNSKYGFHDDTLSELVAEARHAVAIDETRASFAPSLWKRDQIAQMNKQSGFDPADIDAPYQQRWFPGDHGSVGGGGDVRGLSDRGFDWIMEGARKAGLSVELSADSRLFEMRPDPTVSLSNMSEIESPTFGERVAKFFWERAKNEPRNHGPKHLYEVDLSTIQRWHLDDSYRPSVLKGVAEALDELDRRRFGAALPDLAKPENYNFVWHDVKREETLSELARRYYDDQALYWLVFGANLDKIYNPHEIATGWRLRIPARDELVKIGTVLLEIPFIAELVENIGETTALASLDGVTLPKPAP